MSEDSLAIQRCIDQLNQGDTEARGQLIQIAFERLQRMAKKMKRDYSRLERWEQTDDILQNASIRLFEALASVKLENERHFYRLAALQIRRELIDLCRHYHGPLGLGANHQTQQRRDVAGHTGLPPMFDRAEVTSDPRQIQQWGEFHQCAGDLPEKEREVFDLLWYHELSQDDAAELLGISTRQIKRIWRSAKLRLHDHLQGEGPP